MNNPGTPTRNLQRALRQKLPCLPSEGEAVLVFTAPQPCRRRTTYHDKAMCAAAGWRLGDGAGEIAPDCIESVADAGSDTVHGGDRSESDQGGDEGVLDQVLTGFVAEQVHES